MRTSDAISVTTQRATATEALNGLAAIVAVTNQDQAFALALEEACVQGGVDFAFAYSHGANESDYFRDVDFTRDNNAFGIGHPDDAVGGVVFDGVRACARFYVGELLLKLRRPIPKAIEDARSYAPGKWDQVERVVGGALGPFPTVTTIADLNKRFGPDNREAVWMSDPGGPQAIVDKGNALFPNLANQSGDEPTVAGKTSVRIDNAYTDRSYGTLDGPQLWITVHNNGNPSSDRFAEARFVDNGGGDQGVLYHAAADEGGVCAIAALDVKGRHAGNVTGNNTSIAIEMCEGGEPWSAVKENTAQWLAEVVTNSRGVLAYGEYGPKNFSLDRVREHRDWPGANPNCPARLIRTDGGVEKVVARAKEIVRAITATPTTTTTPVPVPPSTYPAKRIPAPDMIEAQGHPLTINKPTRYGAIQGGRFKTGPSLDAPDATPTPYKAGRQYTFDYSTIVGDDEWLVSKAGSWAPARNFKI